MDLSAVARLDEASAAGRDNLWSVSEQTHDHAVLAVPESLLAERGEDLGDRHAGGPGNLDI